MGLLGVRSDGVSSVLSNRVVVEWHLLVMLLHVAAPAAVAVAVSASAS